MAEQMPHPPDENEATLIAARRFQAGGRSVAAGAGWDWIAAAWGYFARDWMMWILIVLVAAIAYVAVNLIPVLGTIAAVLFTPVIGGGLMLGCAEQDRDGHIGFNHLAAGFSAHLRPLAILGLFYVVASAVIFGLIIMIAGAGVMSSIGLSATGHPGAGAGTGVATAMLALLVALAAWLPVLMALWFAPQLVVFQGHAPGQALKASFGACLKNIVPFLVYGVVMLVLSFVASIPLGLGWLVLMPVMVITLYTSYRSVFFSD